MASGRFDGHQLVAIGHSAGSCLMYVRRLFFKATEPDRLLSCLDRGLTIGDEGYPAIRYKAIILVEPSIAPREACFENREEQLMSIKFVIKSLSKRRNFWPNRKEAHAYFAERVPWQLWHPRILELFVVSRYILLPIRQLLIRCLQQDHALRDVTEKDAQVGSNKVTLCCTPKQEWSQYEHEELHYRATDLLAQIDQSVPIHLVLAERVDFM